MCSSDNVQQSQIEILQDSLLRMKKERDYFESSADEWLEKYMKADYLTLVQYKMIEELQKENEILKANNKIPFDIFKSKEVKTEPMHINIDKENIKIDESKIWHSGFNNTSILFKSDKTKEPEITFSEAIELIKNGGCFKVIYENSKIEYIDQYDGLDGIKFKDFFNAKFYVDTDNKIKHF